MKSPEYLSLGPLILTAHVPFYLLEIFGGKSLVEGTDGHFSHLFSVCNLDAIYVEHQHRRNLTSNHRSTYARIYQALLEKTLYQG